METSVIIDLPQGYRIADVLAFHGRDAEGVAEQVEASGLRKGVLLDGVATLLEIVFDGASARCRIMADGAAAPDALTLNDALLNILGLRIDPAAFAAFAHSDALLGPALTRQPGLRIVQSATVFEALTWAIIGQQINLTFAIALRRTLILQAGRQHSSGLWCYPEARDIARLDIGQLTSRKFSHAKADTIHRVAQMVDAGDLSLDLRRNPEQISRELLAIKGIGPWTVNYVLLRGFGYPDCSLHGDVAVRAALHQLSGSAARPSVQEAEQLLQRYAPHRTMAAAYLWASLGETPGAAG